MIQIEAEHKIEWIIYFILTCFALFFLSSSVDMIL